jgi:DNA (cytosine-5)-methyltransferase 1
MKKNINIIDLFAGCGGLSDGFKQAGRYKTIAVVEWEKYPCLTITNRLTTKWKYKNAKDIVLNFDIQRTDELLYGWTNDETYGDNIGLKKIVENSCGQVDMIIGGPPCQAYSVAGRSGGNKMYNDYRNYLFESYLKVVNEFKPKIFVFENVPGILSARPGGVLIIDRITEAFREVGYVISDNLKEDALINCSEYDIPQARKRIIIVGIRRSDFELNSQNVLEDFYKNILPKYKNPVIKTVKDAIGDLPPLIPLKESILENGKKKSHNNPDSKLLSHSPRFHNNRDVSVFKELTQDIEKGVFHYSNSKKLNKLYFNTTGKNTNVHKYHVLRWDKPSTTITAHLHKDGLRHIHPDSIQARSITVREAARLQSFDDNFDFLGPMGEQFKMIGNAVPPIFAKAIAKALHELVTKYKNQLIS